MAFRDSCLVAGVREADFWDMTIGEASRACTAYEEQQKQRAYFAYTNAMTVGLFVGSMFSSKKPPSLHDIYPEYFSVDEEAEEARRDADSAVNFLNFANAFNRDHNNGDRKPESENNG